MDFIYKDSKTKVISFPLGGIGSGCVGLSGTGRLIDWEIFNRPNKLTTHGYSHFAIKAESKEEVVDARILQGDYQPHYIGEGIGGGYHSWGIGHGPNRTTLSSIPHFQDVTFQGTYPIASLAYEDRAFPGSVTLTAFNPFIPNNDKDSSMPAAFFNWVIHNTTDQELTYTLDFSTMNPFATGSRNAYKTDENMSMIVMESEDTSPSDITYGNMTIATMAKDVSYQENWFRGSWFDDLSIYWKNFTTFGPLENRTYEEAGKYDMCTLAVRVTLPPHSSTNIPYILTWFYPNCENYWQQDIPEDVDNRWRNYYASLFDHSSSVANYGLKHWDTLYKDSCLFRDALFSSSLPDEVLDAIQGNIALLKSPTCLRLENGEFYGWEGTHARQGSCEGSCTHVWNYTYALPFLFPNLERSMRDLDYAYNLGEKGDMTFRIQLPLGRERNGFRPCADGQFGGVMKVYREWMISGDTTWLRELWPKVKSSLEYAWHPENPDAWDPKQSGVLTGRQHHTLDMELFGPNSWLTGFYLGALKAGAHMATALGENESADTYMELFHAGKTWVDEHLFNGKYYAQLVDLQDKSILEKYRKEDDSIIHCGDIMDAYWNEESQELKYQIADGCVIDQVVAQWHANLMGLGDIYDKGHCHQALMSLYDLNYKPSMRNHANPCRAYSLNDEAGIVICEWPEDAYKPVVPVPYAEETMNGFEYAAACHMIQEGLLHEGLQIVRGVRDRYDGEGRNPWSEIECGNNYARSMASYGLLLTFSGFKYNMVEKMIGFDPIELKDRYSTFWSIDGAWGTFEYVGNALHLNVLYGQLSLNQLIIPSKFQAVKDVYESSHTAYTYDLASHTLSFQNTLTLGRGDSIYIVL